VELSTPLPVTAVFEGPETRTLVKLKHNVYQLPFAADRAVRVIQGDDGAFSHNGPSRYAVDFDLPEGSPVHAARAGTQGLHGRALSPSRAGLSTTTFAVGSADVTPLVIRTTTVMKIARHKDQ
jgi:hypothetical protein